MSFLAGMLVVASHCAAVAYNRIDTAAERAQVAYIQSQIDLANDIDAEIADLPRQAALKRKGADWIQRQTSNLRHNQDALFADALRQTLELYAIQPVSRSGHIVKHPDLEGYFTKWEPLYEYPAPDIRFIKYGEKLVAVGGNRFSAALTWVDGHITIKREAFTTPGYLAAVIVHETRHFEQATTKGEADVKTRAELENDAYLKTLALREAFELTPDEMEDIYFRWQGELDMDRKEHLTELAKRGGYPYGGFGGEADDPEDDKAEAETKFIHQVTNAPELTDEFERFRGDEAERTRRAEIERARKLKEREERLNSQPSDEVVAAADACGFNVEPTRTIGAFFRDRVLEKGYQYVSMSDPDAARLNLMITRACIERGLRQKEFHPCNHSLSVLASRWDQPGFKDRIGVETYDGKDCFDTVKRRLSASATSDDVAAALKEIGDLWAKKAKESEKEYRDKKRREKEEEARKTRDERIREREGRQRREGGGNIDLSPAEEAVRKLRGR